MEVLQFKLLPIQHEDYNQDFSLLLPSIVSKFTTALLKKGTLWKDPKGTVEQQQQQKKPYLFLYKIIV